MLESQYKNTTGTKTNQSEVSTLMHEDQAGAKLNLSRRLSQTQEGTRLKLEVKNLFSK